MSRSTTFAAATVLVVGLALAACGNDNDSQGETNSNSSTSLAQVETAVKPASKSDAVVQKFTTALDDLNIKHAEPTRGEVGLSGAQMVFEMAVNGYDAGINIFPDEETLTTWQETSDSFGGIHVALRDEYAVLSLNSSEGVADSAKIAPMIADAVGGTAHGV